MHKLALRTNPTQWQRENLALGPGSPWSAVNLVPLYGDMRGLESIAEADSIAAAAAESATTSSEKGSTSSDDGASRPDSGSAFKFAFPNVMPRGSMKSASTRTPTATDAPSNEPSPEWRSFVAQLAVIAGGISPAGEASDGAIMKIKRLMVEAGFERNFARLISTVEIRLGSDVADVSARLAGKQTANFNMFKES